MDLVNARAWQVKCVDDDARPMPHAGLQRQSLGEYQDYLQLAATSDCTASFFD
jgi:hypothetical protein